MIAIAFFPAGLMKCITIFFLVKAIDSSMFTSGYSKANIIIPDGPAEVRSRFLNTSISVDTGDRGITGYAVKLLSKIVKQVFF